MLSPKLTSLFTRFLQRVLTHHLCLCQMSRRAFQTGLFVLWLVQKSFWILVEPSNHCYSVFWQACSSEFIDFSISLLPELTKSWSEAVHSDTASIINIDNVSQKSTLIRNQGGKITLFKIVNTSWERESWKRKERMFVNHFMGQPKTKRSE